MSAALIAACLWVILATAVAFFPMRRQYAPGLALLLAAPCLLLWLGVTHGFGLVAFGLFAFVSMFRRPLWHLGRHLLHRLTGRAV